MSNCKNFRMALYVKQEPCLDGRENFDGLNLLPCIHQNQGACDGHALRKRDKPTPWQPAGGPGYDAVIERSQRTFGDNPNKD